jgi:hypothetical protein
LEVGTDGKALFDGSARAGDVARLEAGETSYEVAAALKVAV